MDVENKLAVGGEEQMLASPASTGEAASLERGQRGIERLQRRDVRRPGARDRRAPDGLVNRAP
jgi:hypothetical protein